MAVLILAWHDNATLNPAVKNAVSAALALDGPVHVLVAGWGAGDVASAAATIDGVSKVLHAEDQALEYQSPELVAPLIARLTSDYGSVDAPAGNFAKSVIPRAAGILDMAQVSDVIEIKSPDTFVHPIYAGNALETVTATDRVKIITVRATAFPAASISGQPAEIKTITAVTGTAVTGTAVTGTPGVQIVERQLAPTDRPDLNSARIVVSGGRGMGTAKAFAILEDVAAQLGAAIGATRAAVDAGYVSNDLQVGQTGKVVAPEMYLAVGISGAIQHLAGMKDSKVIAAINNDPSAPIFQVANYGLVADLHVALPELQAELSRINKESL
jgi:electron transfer flavoprotein alpha subunit